MAKLVHIPKLIETSLPLEAINEVSACEKSIRHGKDVYVKFDHLLRN